MTGIGFGGFTERGHDYLDEEHGKSDGEPVTQSELDDIRAEIVAIRATLTMVLANLEKAEIEADLAHLSIETERPEPKRSSLRSFFMGLRESLMKATTQEGVHQAFTHLESFAKLRGWL